VYCPGGGQGPNWAVDPYDDDTALEVLKKVREDFRIDVVFADVPLQVLWNAS
jgi:hypothetical protein